MNNPFDYIPDESCSRAFEKLFERIESLRGSKCEEDINFCKSVDKGKMLGVLIAEDSDGDRKVLYAFSGQLGDAGFHYSGFVNPVFDYLDPEGYFKTKENEISVKSEEIKYIETSELVPLREEYERHCISLEKEIEEYRSKLRKSKNERAKRRAESYIDEAENADMIRQSQFEKAELRRIKKRSESALEPYKNTLKHVENHLAALKEHRRRESEELQEWLFANFKLLNARGEEKSLKDIFAATPLRTPPSGAGECCAPKLLQAAYRQGLKPIAMAEYWYCKEIGEEVRIHGRHYPACRGKCLPILKWMLQGLSIEPPIDGETFAYISKEPEILYENRWFCVVNKPAGMISVRGKGERISVQQWLEEKYGIERDVKVAHRLDQDTSGLLIATFGTESYRNMQRLFASRRVKKMYIADLEGDYEQKGHPQMGRIELPLSPDILDRPRQRIDLEGGKEAVTEYEFIGYKDGKSRIAFYPLTGRTHQLRLHAAAGEGLGMPIVGDRLYGHGIKLRECDGRMHLHAQRIEFKFPIDQKNYIFEIPVPF